jgi:hypothetical protein
MYRETVLGWDTRVFFREVFIQLSWIAGKKIGQSTNKRVFLGLTQWFNGSLKFYN